MSLPPTPKTGVIQNVNESDSALTGRAFENFGARLNHLLGTVPSPNGSLWSHAQLSAALTESGTPATPSYISQLRNGKKDNPTVKTVEGLARLFGVPVAYFHDDEVADKFNANIADLIEIREAAGLNSLFRGLTAPDRKVVESLITALLEQHGSKSVNEDPPPTK